MFKKKNRTPYAFRVRAQKGSVRLGAPGRPRTVRIPKVGVVRVREDTRGLRRMLRPCSDGTTRARITAVTVRTHRGRWIASITVQAADLHPSLRHPSSSPRGAGDTADWVGIDRGLIDLVVAATGDGRPVARVSAGRTYQRRQDGLAARQRRLTREQSGSKRRARAVEQVREFQARTAAIREHRLHQVTNLLVKNHDRLVIENLHVVGMLADHRLAKALTDASFGNLARMLTYESEWRGGVLVEADRWFPSSKICSACGHRANRLGLAERTYRCGECGLHIDRDLNAAINLAAQGPHLLRTPHRTSGPNPGPRTRKQRAGSPTRAQVPERRRPRPTGGAAAKGPSTARTGLPT
ncbi:transposase [Actinocorallia herbida]|uniref:Transposase n=1 Tax=Actinocorallia herbida TaxID=58109 RepID=A0A3N1CPC5_9ACTN|nr:RNA-guided endonuclease TnpB family protein [Actinocorallia herbida]ROO83176.1 transposase [Actinocorallia herbida]